ncbi:uncharacterized protein WM277_024817 isoform 1-T1 [Molossus nigricans]
MWKKLQGNSKKIPQKAIRALTCVSECSRAGEEKTGSEWMMERDDSRENGTCEANVWSVGSHSHEAGQGYVSRVWSCPNEIPQAPTSRSCCTCPCSAPQQCSELLYNIPDTLRLAPMTFQ